MISLVEVAGWIRRDYIQERGFQDFAGIRKDLYALTNKVSEEEKPCLIRWGWVTHRLMSSLSKELILSR